MVTIDSDSQSEEPMVVGLGASAGGLDALKRFFSHVQKDSGLTYVVVVHLSPEHPSLLADLLQSVTPIPVLQVVEDTVMQPNHVYVIPPGSNLSDFDTHLRLSRIETQRRLRAPVDHFFETLARIHENRCIGVILSGTGSDGSLGIRRIKEYGGLTIAQDPNEAGFDGMPQSAIATNLIDLILPAAEMPQFIQRFADTHPHIEINEETDKLPVHDEQTLQHIFSQVRARTGRDFIRCKRSTVLRRIRRRMQLHQLERIGDYLDYLCENPNEAYLLAEEFLINATRFFSDAETFAYLEKQVVPELFEGKSTSDTVRVWTVGCATGEVAYSIAMLLLEHAAGIGMDAPRLEIFASDLHDNSLQHARNGIYPDTIEEDVSAQRLQRFFTKDKSGYQVRKELREIVVFAAHNLLRDPPFSRLDLIICRNLLIYLQRQAQHDVVGLFHYALRNDGRLLLGPSETIDRNALFLIEDKHHCLYRRRNMPPPEPGLPVFPYLPRRYSRESQPRIQELQPTSYGKLHLKMVERYALPNMLIDQDFRIVHNSEHAGRYLQVPGGELSSNVFKLVREELRIELRTALHAAADHGSSSRVGPIPISIEGEPRQVILHVRPSSDPELSGLSLVIFDEMEPGESTLVTGAGSDDADGLLEQARERLRTVIEQYETSQEEMQASNEELQSTMEELQSTMEELETSKEELQSMNEELQSMNEELQSMNEELQTANQENHNKVEELSQLTADLNNLISATDIATLFLDRELRILRVTPRTRKFFNIRGSDRGRPLTDLRHQLGYDELEEDARQVLEKLSPVEREIRSESGEWYLTRLLPYRSTTDQIQGVVITLVDVTDLKRAELALRNSEERYRALVTASAQMVWTMDQKGEALDDPPPSWRAYTGLTFRDWQTDGWLAALHPEDLANARDNWLRCVSEITPYDMECRLQHVGGEWHWNHIRAVPLCDDQGEVRGWVGMNTDIDDRKRAEEALQQSDRRKDEFLALLAHELRNPLASMQTAVELLKRQLPDEPEIQRICSLNERQVHHLSRLVDDLLDVARIKSGRIDLRKQLLDLREVARNAIADKQAAISARHHRLSVDLSTEALMIEVDEVRLVQIITNLLDNAIKYTPDGGRLSVRASRQGEIVELCVGDNGFGLEPELKTHAFDAFERGSVRQKGASDGLGLGLTLVQRLTQLHGGSVEARSEGPGLGSEFIVRLPLSSTREEKPSAGQDEDKTEPGNPAERLKRILVVDDNQDAANSLALLLEISGYQVHAVHDGQHALTLAREFLPEAVVLDIGLPDMDGYALARELRKQTADKPILLIAVTGYGTSEDRALSSKAGIDHHLVKPVDSATLMALLVQSAQAEV